MRPPDLVSGPWETDSGRERLDLRLEEGGRVTGTVTSAGPSHAVPIASGRFEAGRLTLEGESVPASGSAAVPFLINGTLIAPRRLDVSFRSGEFHGTATFVRPSAWRALRRHARVAVQRLFQRAEPIAVHVVRYFRGLRRPSPATNARALRARSESLDAFVFRDATPDDLAALADLHAKTWAATYPGVQHPPTAALRESQWREAFHKMDGSWFAVVVQRPDGKLIGFAKGIRHDNGVGDLNKIYLVTEYQRLGLGRRLVGHVARRFLAMGQSSMRLSADAANPSCHFYYALGARNPRDADGHVHYGAFLWDDLEALSERCPE